MPYDKKMLGIREAKLALDAMLKEAETDAKAGRPVVIAIVDDYGDLVAYARQDRALHMSHQAALRKAFTSARGRADSGDYAKHIMKQQNRPIELHFGMQGTSSAGGIVIKDKDGMTLGGIGVSGAANSQRDIDIGRAGLKAMRL